MSSAASDLSLAWFGLRIIRAMQPSDARAARQVVLVEAVSQTNGIGAKQQQLGEPLEADASGELLRASAGSARLISLDEDLCSWCSITNSFRSVTFVKQPPSEPRASNALIEHSQAAALSRNISLGPDRLDTQQRDLKRPALRWKWRWRWHRPRRHLQPR